MGILGSLLGTDASKASNAAAADTYAKQQAATKKLTEYGDTLPGQYNQISEAYQPYTSAGNSALKQLLAGLGLGGDQQAFTDAYHNLPGYQSGLDAGATAAMRGLNAGPGLQSGGALKALQRYGSDYENQRSGDYLSRLGGLASSGLGATQAQVGTQAQGLGANTAIRQSAYGGDMNSAGTIGQGMVAGAQAEQTAMGNLLGTAAYLGGSFLGGPAGAAGGSALKGLFSGGGNSTPSAYGTGNYGGYGKPLIYGPGY